MVRIPNSRPLLLGHRGVRPLPYLGLRWRKPGFPAENTSAAFEYALANGCDGFEFDVRFTSDRRHVLHHDPKFGRREIATTEYSGLERRHRFERRGIPMACLEDVLAGFGNRAYLDIELKVTGGEEEIVSLLETHPPQRGYVVSSFLPEVLLRLHALNEKLRLGYVCKRAEDVERWRDLPIAVFIPQCSLVSQSMIADVHARGIELITWTINQQAELVRLAGRGVDGLISDDPRLLTGTFLR